MKNITGRYNKMWILYLVVGTVLFTGSALAANDPSIKGTVRQKIVQSMDEHIQYNTIGGTYSLYDAVEGKLLNLKFKRLHDGIVKKGDYYVSCADFVDQMGRTVDVDFMVRTSGETFQTTQALVHSIDGAKRKYHLE